MHLIFFNSIYTFSESIPNFTPSTNFADRFKTYVALSAEQEAYYAAHPAATVEEVWSMSATAQQSELTNDQIRQLRQAAYEQRSDSLYMAWQKYLAQGEADKAAAAQAAWLAEVVAIEEEYPYNVE